MKRAVCWIRRDLRLYDHVALAEACRVAEQVAVVFVMDRKILDVLPRQDRRVTFIHESLIEIDEILRKLGSRLTVLHGNPVDLIPDFCKSIEADGLFFNRDFDPYALQRDKSIVKTLRADGLTVKSFKDHVVFEGHEIRNQSGEPFKVFTPYSKAWKARLEADMSAIAAHDPDLSRVMPLSLMTGDNELKPIEEYGFENHPCLVPSGQSGAAETFENFLPRINQYKDERDFFGIDGTSNLSVHLRHGTISNRECMRHAVAHRPTSEKWFNELIWREFYQMILAEFPHVVEGSFRPELDRLTWEGSDAMFQAWCEGKTGYPIVDAAMRCLNATGQMHNRLRMVAAMFLTKDLHVHWQKGEAYFAEKLLDFDLASNNGGWQWSASTGVDSQPYFRVFNPILQSRKFDPEAVFIRMWCPELNGFDNNLIHWPADATVMEQLEAECILEEAYPAPIVEHRLQAEKAKAMFEVLKA